jgi:hypothetical protein
MNIPKFVLLLISFSFASLFGQAELPPLEKSVEDPSTGLNVGPGWSRDISLGDTQGR